MAAWMTTYAGGIEIGQSWRDDSEAEACRVVTIDPALHLVGVEQSSGEVLLDTIEHFLDTHHAEAC